MRATVSISKQQYLKDAKPGDIFLLHYPGLSFCVCTLLLIDGMPLVCYGEDGEPLSPRQRCVVVLACLVAPGEDGHVATGSLHKIDSLGYSITRLEQVEPSAFRELAADDVVPYRKRETPLPAAVAGGDHVFETLIVQPAAGPEAAPLRRE